jgi:hypothetical protein
MRLLAYPAFISVLHSCNFNEPALPAPANKLNAPTVGTGPQKAVVDSVFNNYPVDTFYQANLLTTGNFHEEEVVSEELRFDWYGIFKNKEGYYLDSTHIIAKRVYDPVADEDGKTTGWEVKTNNSDTTLLLIANVDGLSKRKIVPAQVSDHLLPGESVSFTYNGIAYTLYATGNKYAEGTENARITNYRLFISAAKKGIERTQLLVASPQLGDVLPTIRFAGDIDGDDVPDLIIDTSINEDAEMPTLYLSKPAGSTQLLKVMGMHVTVGC